MNACRPPVSSCSAADLQQVIDALGHRLDVAVEHRHVGAHAEAVRGAVHRQVAVAVALVVGDLAAHPRREDLGAAAGQRIEAGLAQLHQHLLVGLAVVVGEEGDLHRREALQVDAGPHPLQAAQQVGVVAERQPRVQAVHHVHLGERLAVAGPQAVQHLLDRRGVRAGLVGRQPRERAEQARRLADVGGLEPQVVVEVGAAAVAALALAVGEPADGSAGRARRTAARRPRSSGARAPRPCRRCR